MWIESRGKGKGKRGNTKRGRKGRGRICKLSPRPTYSAHGSVYRLAISYATAEQYCVSAKTGRSIFNRIQL